MSRYETPAERASKRLWQYAGWLVLADGWENTENAASVAVFRCKRRNCHALVAAHPLRLAEHEQEHDDAPNKVSRDI